jgi:hypothetical protein
MCVQQSAAFTADVERAALICGASAAYAAEDDNKIHPTCVEENNTRRCWVDHGPPAGARPPQLQPVAPAPQAAIPPTPAAMVATAVYLPVRTVWVNSSATLSWPAVERQLTEPRAVVKLLNIY